MKNYQILAFAKLVQQKIYAGLLFVLFSQFVNAQNPHPEWGLGAKFLTPAQYEALPNANWAEIKSYSTVITSPEGTYGTNGVTMLNNPPIGDQQTQGSCVGWATGYTAMSILTYPKFHCWADARRSPNYVYNQIKVNSDCGSGSYVFDGVALLKNQGDCSWNLMPYNNSDCATQPNATQTTNAGQNKAINWAKLTKNDYANIKLALDLGFPVVVGQKVFQSFYDMWINGGVWSSNYGSYYGNHATCIVGYDDTRQQFKVQNQWGTFGGDNGYYWVTYNMVQNNCFDEVYVVYGNNGSTTLDITGPASICLPVTSGTYTVGNLSCNTTVSWSTNVSQVTFSPATGATTTVNANGYTGTVTLTATITNSSGTIQIIKPIQMGTGPSTYSFTPYITQNGVTTYMSNFCNRLTYLCTNSNASITKGGDIEPNFVSPNNYCASGYITDPTVNSITWSVAQQSPVFHGSYIFTGNQFQVFINANYTSEWVILRCTRTNSCGSAYSYYKFYVDGGCVCPGLPYCELPVERPSIVDKYTISPNPTNGQFNISLNSTDTKATIKEVIIKNKMG